MPLSQSANHLYSGANHLYTMVPIVICSFLPIAFLSHGSCEDVASAITYTFASISFSISPILPGKCVHL